MIQMEMEIDRLSLPCQWFQGSTSCYRSVLRAVSDEFVFVCSDFEFVSLKSRICISSISTLCPTLLAMTGLMNA